MNDNAIDWHGGTVYTEGTPEEKSLATLEYLTRAHNRLMRGNSKRVAAVRRTVEDAIGVEHMRRYRIGIDGTDTLTLPSVEWDDFGLPMEVCTRLVPDELDEEFSREVVWREWKDLKESYESSDGLGTPYPFPDGIPWHFEDSLRVDAKKREMRLNKRAHREFADETALDGWDMPALGGFDASGGAEIAWLVDGLLPRGMNVLLSGAPKKGKTTLTLGLARALVYGESFLGRETPKITGSVVVVDLENDPATLDRWAATIGLSDRAYRFALRGETDKFNITVPQIREKFAAKLREVECEVLVIDPLFELANALNISDSSNSDMGALTYAISQLQKEADLSSVFVTHHTGHSDDTRARGASALLGWADVNWNLRGSGVTRRKFTAKGRDVDDQTLDLDFDKATLIYRSEGTKEERTDARLTALQDVLEGNPGGISTNQLWKSLADQNVTVGKRFRNDFLDTAENAGILKRVKTGDSVRAPIMNYPADADVDEEEDYAA